MVVIRNPLCLCHFLIYSRRPCLGFLLLVCLNSHFSLFCWMFGRSIIKHSQRSITRDILCLSRSSAAASACAQSHGKLRKKKGAQHTHAVCQAVVASASRPVGKRHLSIAKRSRGGGRRAGTGDIRFKEEEQLE